jgi:hypothetical protein
MVEALLTLVRGTRSSDTERTVLSAALRVLSGQHLIARQCDPAAPAPLLADLLAVIEAAPDTVRLPTLDRGDLTAYRSVVDPLQRSLLSLLDGPLGSVFARPTTERIRLDAPAVCVDVSGISVNDTALQAAVLLACWAEGFGACRGRQRPGRRRPGPAAPVLHRPGRAVAGPAQRRRDGRQGRRTDPAEPQQRRRPGDDHALDGGPAGAAQRRGPRQGQGLHRTRRPGRLRRSAGPGGRRAVGDRRVLPGRAAAGHQLVDPTRLGRRGAAAGVGKFLIKSGQRPGSRSAST